MVENCAILAGGDCEKKGEKMNATQRYDLNFQNLMDAVPTSGSVAKQVDESKFNNKVYRDITWVVDGYMVYSASRAVYSVSPNFEESLVFSLKLKDYKKFVVACETRRQELFGKSANKKTR